MFNFLLFSLTLYYAALISSFNLFNHSLLLMVLMISMFFMMAKILLYSKSIIKVLLSMELVMLMLFLTLCITMSKLILTPMLVFMFMTISVCEATLGIALLVSTTRSNIPSQLKILT